MWPSWRPTVAQVETVSLLGGDAQVVLIRGASAAERILPGAMTVTKDLLVCAGGELQGVWRPPALAQRHRN